jgi:hypothetical protein
MRGRSAGRRGASAGDETGTNRGPARDLQLVRLIADDAIAFEEYGIE